MPAPDPESLWINEDGSVTFQRYFWTGNSGNRAHRAIAIHRRIRQGSWSCRWCRDDLPAYRRSDAQYCCEGCRKRAARHRRAGTINEWVFDK